MYKVVKRFVDLQDNNYKYEAGDEYPRLGYEPSLVRINELSTKNNLQKAILIKDFEDIDEKKEIDLEKNDEITEETEKPKEEEKEEIRVNKCKEKIMELKLKEILDYIHNYFMQDTFEGKIKIKNHELDNHEIGLLDDQYFMIKGSIYNDGIWQFKAIQEVDEENLERYLKDEEFNGIISKLAIPRDVLALKDEIIAWEDKNQDALNGVFQSESFGGYSYTLKSNSSNNKNGESISWKNKFGNRLKAYRKLG